MGYVWESICYIYQEAKDQVTGALMRLPSDVFRSHTKCGDFCSRQGLMPLEASVKRDYGYTLLMLATLPNKTRNKKLHNTPLIPLTKVTPARVRRHKLTSD